MSEQTDNKLEFDVPPTADMQQSFPNSATHGHSRKHFSIDLSLELERQLEMDDLPKSPEPNVTEHDKQPSRDSLDPHVLAHIIMQLRQTVAEMTKERDDLLQLVSDSTAEKAQLNDALQLMTEKATSLDEAYTEAKRKMKEDEEAISMLRTKVEESRRGVMRLQSENRRQSVGPVPLDLSRAGSVVGSPLSSKRSSFTPLTGSYTSRPKDHRRISSYSDTGLDLSDPTGQTVLISELPGTLSKSARRASSFLARSPQPQTERDPLLVEMETMRRTMSAVKDELEETRHELMEMKEAKDASESCVQALRDFIAVHNVGSYTNNGPPNPSAVDPNARKPFTGSTGWGFNKLWRVDTSVKPAADPAATTPTPTNEMPSTTVPFTRKIGGLFGSRAASVSSITSDASPSLPPPAPHRDSVYSVSDSSSLAEPLSPTSDDAHQSHVVVRSSSDAGSVGGSPVTDNTKTGTINVPMDTVAI